VKRAPRHFSAAAQRSSDPPISWLMKLALERPSHVNLAAGFTDNETLPVAEVAGHARELLRDAKAARAALQYGTTIGLPALREQLARRLQARAEPVAAANIIITNGSQQLLWLVTEALCDAGDIVGAEDPTYFVYLGITEAIGARTFGFNSVSNLQARLEKLKQQGQLARLKLLYLVTYFQNPTGHTWSLAEKREAWAVVKHYERAAGHPIYILEDAGYRDLRIEGADVTSFLPLDPRRQRVIYSSTLSKPFATGLRLGYAAVPPLLLDAVLRSKGNQDFGSANFLQTLLSRALASGDYERHLPVLSQSYRQKRDALVSGLRAHLPVARFETPRGGLFVWAELPGKQKTGFRSGFFARALAAGVLYVPGEICFCADDERAAPRHAMRLSFGAAQPAELVRGTQLLSQALAGS